MSSNGLEEEPTITAFSNSPDKGQGHAGDMRVRWALEEVGQPYKVRLQSMKELHASTGGVGMSRQTLSHMVHTKKTEIPQ